MREVSTLCWLLVAVGCGSPPAVVPPASRPPDPLPTAPAPTAEVSEPAPTLREQTAPFVMLPSEKHPELVRFYGALRQLELGTRKEHVRVYFMGDSHAAADFWSGTLRSSLQSRFGDGGPGFLHLGYRDYRHDGVKLDIRGKWRLRPKKPAGIESTEDGSYSLGGLWLGGYKDGPRVRVELTGRAPDEDLTYDFCYRLRKPEDKLEILAAGIGAPRTLARADTIPDPGPQHFHVAGRVGGGTEGELDNTYVFSAKTVGGSPDYCGVSIEKDPSKKPGVVLDTLGINGARYATALSWDEAQWISEAKRRPPNLLVLEYGTNEVGDISPAYDKTAKNLGALVERARRAAPELECVVISATDRFDAEDRVPLMNARLKEASKKSGCAFFDAWTHLGGKGALTKLREEAEPRAQQDGVHLTIKGYRELGKVLAEDIMSGYPYR